MNGFIIPYAGRQADDIQKRARHLESKCMNNEVNIDDLEKLVNEAKTMFMDSEKKLDESTRRLGMMEDELKRAEERALMAENRVTVSLFILIIYGWAK